MLKTWELHHHCVDFRIPLDPFTKRLTRNVYLGYLVSHKYPAASYALPSPKTRS
jgi:hypothetical protein